MAMWDGGTERLAIAEENRRLRERIRALESERDDLREVADRFALVTDSLPSLVAYTDRDERYRFVNAAYEKWFGVSVRDLLGRTLREVVGDAAYAELEEPVRRALAGETVRWETYLPYRLGGGRHVEINYVPHVAPDGTVLGYCVLVHDMTERKIHERTLQDADSRKDAFLAMLAHELRNPLSALRTGTALLTQIGDRPEKLAALQGAMERQVNQLVYLVDDLLDVSRISRGKVTLRREQVRLDAVLGQAIDSVRAALDQAQQKLVVRMDEELVLAADPNRLTQVLSNLLSNASKFTPPGGHIEVEAALQGDEIVLSVSDDGSGIEPALLGSIFEMFAQAEQPLEGARGGLGLGLALVRLLTELHGGQVSAESAGPGQGTRFVVRLPADAELPPPASERPTSTVSMRHLGLRDDGASKDAARVLVVDDNEDAAQTLCLLLEAEGHRVETVHDGRSAVAAARRIRPDVVLLDLSMPEMDGFEVARRLQGQSPTERPFLVALTGWGQETDKERSRAAGFDLHVTKPVDPRYVCEVVARASQRPRATI